ncbi:MAG: LLM class flavin-dependent oxidoreductase [Anaerolineae bacterium]|nr:LLM class flavin-dependent oxidoreductase [Anaerolineae bacterium]
MKNRVNTPTFVELLQEKARTKVHENLYTFLVTGEDEEERLTYAQLDLKARAVAAQLQQIVDPGARALLLYPPGLDYIVAFLGCLYAGVIAVPVYPPDPTALQRTLPRLHAIALDAKPQVALTTSPILMMAEMMLSQTPGFPAIEWLATDTILTNETTWQEPNLNPDTVAFLQYTSGSTGTPKGVMLTHRNLLHNSALIYDFFGHSPQSQGVIWLPPYHDMGLIGGILQPLYGGFPVTLMSPLDFLQRPFRWLQAVSKYKATTSGGPNFAYELCIRKITPEQRATLDLSQWQVAFNGAEPIRPETMDRFAAVFESCGFRREAFYPCYGLAEATLIVSGGDYKRVPVVSAYQQDAMAQNKVLKATYNDPKATILVSCGQSTPDQQLAIVRPTSLTPCAPGEIGEVWVSGPSVSPGYWQRTEETDQVCRAMLLGRGPFLRTGDLGFLQEGELYITGRLKDLIIIRGQNYYPQDIELTVEQCHPALRPGCGAAFSVAVDSEEKLVVVQELDTRQPVDSTAVINSIRQAVSSQHGLQLHTVALIKARTIPKTSSGKIQRYACRHAYLAEELELIEQSILSTGPSTASETSFIRKTLLVMPNATARASVLMIYLQEQAAKILRLPSVQFSPHRSLNQLGIDSLTAVELKNQIDTELGVEIPLAHLLSGITLAGLADMVLVHFKEEQSQLFVEGPVAPTPTVIPASYGQRALWYLQQFAPDSTAYHIVSAVQIHSSLDIVRLHQALTALVTRHPSLRARFFSEAGQVMQHFLPEGVIDFVPIDARQWTPSQLNVYLTEEAHRSFDLSQDALFRVRLCQQPDSTHVLLLVTHHIIADFWSLAVLAHELGMFYADPKASLPPLNTSYASATEQQNTLLAGEDGEKHWTYWQQQLNNPLPILNLPTDYPRPPIQSFKGASQSIQLGHTLTEKLQSLSREQDVTLYMTLLAAFTLLLSRYSGQQDILVGSPTYGRSRPELTYQVGYFVNPVVMRSTLQAEKTFATFLQTVRQTALDAFDHQAYPFSLLAERLHPHRDPSRSPIFQAMFMYQQAPRFGGVDLAAFALGEPGTSVRMGELVVEPFPLSQQAAQFDVTLMMAETPQGLRATIQYSQDLFAAETIHRMLANFQTLLAAITENPQRPLFLLPLLSSAERQLLQKWNTTATALPANQRIDTLFEAQVDRTPTAIALVFEEQLLTYTALNQRANQLAYYLRTQGAAPGANIGVYMTRSLDTMVALLAVLKSGSTYIPLDPGYPAERIGFILTDAQTPLVLTQSVYAEALPFKGPNVIAMDAAWPTVSNYPTDNPNYARGSGLPAYVIYTSGSTGQPKGVVVTHDNVVNFFTGMDERIGCDENDTMLAVTSISFDISVLELFWTLVRGAKVVILGEQAVAGEPKNIVPDATQPIEFSLFYFAADENSEASNDKYQLLLEGARYADENGFQAVWTPERHFHAFGGLYPNPAVTAAAIATITKRVQIRAGSVVIPLHHPVRIAEEWSVVDNLSQGRVGIAVASGWHANDFAFFPENYAERKEITRRNVEIVRQLWRGEPAQVSNGVGQNIEVIIRPRPIQAELPLWLTAAGNAETFIMAGQMGAGVLTHLLGQSLDDVAAKIVLYRQARMDTGYDPDTGHVVLMLHTFIGDDLIHIRETVRTPFTNYLRTSAGLMAQLARAFDIPFDMDNMNEADLDALLQFAFARYHDSSALFGTAESTLALIDKIKQIGVNEVACLIDFGLPTEQVLAHLPHLHRLQELANGRLSVTGQEATDFSLVAQAKRHQPTMMQCTPSYMRLILMEAEAPVALNSLKTLLLGGEALPANLAQHVRETLPARLVNMYGPTETTIWSLTHQIDRVDGIVPIGRPIANTQVYVLDDHFQPVPIGVVGELVIGGRGVAAGYLHRPELTAEKFIQLSSLSNLLSVYGEPVDHTSPAAAYRTGDLARYLPDGSLEFLGRRDFQMKLRGYRVELGEIETVLAAHPDVDQAVVVPHEETPEDIRLVAYYIPPIAESAALRHYLRERLPEYMIPAAFVPLEELPLTANGKVNRQALPKGIPAIHGGDSPVGFVAPRSQVEQQIAEIWLQALKLEKVGVYDNFFDLGGHSLLMAQVHSQLRERHGYDLPLVRLLEHPTISDLAKFLTAERDEMATIVESQSRAQKQLASRRRARKVPPTHSR